jgi:hypothetical protein
MLMLKDHGMTFYGITPQSVQTSAAYLGSLLPGFYLASAYSGIATKAIFIAIPVIALKIARVRSRTTSDIIMFPAEVASQSTHVLAELDTDTHPRYIAIASRAS